MSNIGTRIDFEVFTRKIKERGKPGTQKVTINDIKELLEAAETLREPDKLTTAYILSGDFYLDRGDFDAAGEAAEKAMSYAMHAGEDRFMCAALNLKGNVEFRCGEYDKSERTLKGALEKARKSGATGELLDINSSLGVLKARVRRYSEAEEYFREALTIALAVGFRKKQVDISVNLGNVYYSRGDISKAISTFEEARVKTEDIGYLNPVGRILNGLGTIYQTVGLFDEAIKTYKESIDYYRRFEDPVSEGIGCLNLASTYIEMEDAKGAEPYCDIAQRVFQPEASTSDPTYFFYATVISSDVYYLLGDYDEAAKCISDAADIASGIGFTVGEGRVLFRQARIDLKKGEAEGAYEKIRKAISISEDSKFEFSYQYEFILYQTLKALGDTAGAREVLRSANSHVTDYYEKIPEGDLRDAFLKHPECAEIIRAVRDEGIEDTIGRL